MDDRDLKLQERRAKRRRNELIIKCIISFLVVALIFLAVILVKDAVIPGISRMMKERAQKKEQQATTEEAAAVQTESQTTAAGTEEELIAQADLLAAQYDYDGAIALLKDSEYYISSQTMQTAAAGYQSVKESCKSYPVEQITHVFFHTLVYDTSKAFDGGAESGGYNQTMTTMSEFAAMMESMYEKGYVMVSLHDMCTVNDDGTVSAGEIRLPSGKIPFVLSQDDVSYYHYMDGDGFAQKLVIDENGDVKNTYLEDDGSVSVGIYDLVPWIDTFVEEHPDFSYHGHKGVIALTGYEGVLGYRTDEVYLTRDADRVTSFQQRFFEQNPDFDEEAWQAEVDQATAVADAMKASGWEFASHTWGHISPTAKGLETTMTDTQRWLENVAPIVGDTDTIIFAFGADIGGWEPYTDENEYFSYLKSQGFSIYCNVDASQTYWVQFGSNYMRQGRRNLDGYRMYYTPELVSDLFDVSEVWDDSRPTPVPEM